MTFFNRIHVEGSSDVPDVIAALNPQWAMDGQLAMSLQIQGKIVDSTGQQRGGRTISLGYRPEFGALQLESSSLVSVDPKLTDSAAILAALDEAHHAAVLAFDQITTGTAHNAWGKHDAGDN